MVYSCLPHGIKRVKVLFHKILIVIVDAVQSPGLKVNSKFHTVSSTILLHITD